MGLTEFGPAGSQTTKDADGVATQGGVGCLAKAAADKPGLLRMDAVSDAGAITTYYLWVDSTGDLRINSGIPTDQDSDGTVVGTQS